MPLFIRVDPPVADRAGEWISPIECPLIGEAIRPARSNSPGLAYSLAFRFLRSQLVDFAVLDATGCPVALPRVPPYLDDGYSPHTPADGMVFVANTVDGTGESGRIRLELSPPETRGTGFVVVARYGGEGAPGKEIAGATAAAAFAAGLRWLQDRLDADGVILLDRWNEPVDLHMMFGSDNRD